MDFKNSKKKGDAGLGCAIGYFCSKGYGVSIPLTDSQDYDLVVELDDGALKKVQVRSTWHKGKSGAYSVPLRVLGGNSKKNFVHKKGTDVIYDLLFAMCGDGSCYLIPKPVFAEHTSALVVGKKYADYMVTPPSTTDEGDR